MENIEQTNEHRSFINVCFFFVDFFFFFGFWQLLFFAIDKYFTRDHI